MTQKKFIVATGIAAFLVSPLPLTLAAATLDDAYPSAGQKFNATWQGCGQTADFAELSKLPQGLIMAELDLGPYILALSEHSVISAPYHRISNQILQTMHFFESNTVEEAHDIVKKQNIDYVVICNKKDREPKQSSAFLGENIRARTLPTWLEALSGESKNPIEIYRVK